MQASSESPSKWVAAPRVFCLTDQPRSCIHGTDTYCRDSTGEIQTVATEDQNRVVAAIWRWRDSPVDEARARTRERRRRSLVQSAIMLTVGLIFLLAFDFRVMGTIALCLAAVVFLSARFVPPLYRGLERSVALLARAVGVCVTWLVLVPFFYLCFVPGKLLLLATRKDPLHRKFQSGEKTYWTPRKPSQPKHYDRQY